MLVCSSEQEVQTLVTLWHLWLAGLHLPHKVPKHRVLPTMLFQYLHDRGVVQHAPVQEQHHLPCSANCLVN